MIGLLYDEKNCDDMLSHFHLIPERHGQTDRRTDRFAISISRVSMLTRDKKISKICFLIYLFCITYFYGQCQQSHIPIRAF